MHHTVNSNFTGSGPKYSAQVNSQSATKPSKVKEPLSEQKCSECPKTFIPGHNRFTCSIPCMMDRADRLKAERALERKRKNNQPFPDQS